MTAPDLRVVPPVWDDDGPGPPHDRIRPEVKIGQDSSANVDALDAALAVGAPDVFHRSMQLVEVISEVRPRLIAQGAPVLRGLNKHSLELHVSRHLNCLRWHPANPKSDEPGSWIPARASAETAILPMLAYGRWSKIRPITGITESPLFRPDGTIMQEAGYDELTGYLYRPNADYPPVPLEPTQEDARLALKSLQHVFCDFPYVSPPASAVPIAALLTILARAAIDGNVPVFAFEASNPGLGKDDAG